jgi:hypothetical protein
VRHVTAADDILFDAHQLTGVRAPPRRLNLVVVDGVWCRPLARQRTAASSASGPKQDHLS